MKYNLIFSECDHEEDLSRYIEDIRKAGGSVLDARLLHDEAGLVIVELPHPEHFFRLIDYTNELLSYTPVGKR